MKSLFLTVLCFSQFALAGQKYTYYFYMNRPSGFERLEYTVEANNEEQAFETAALYCFKHFKKGQKLTEDRGLDIIDVCANPRKK